MQGEIKAEQNQGATLAGWISSRAGASQSKRPNRNIYLLCSQGY